MDLMLVAESLESARGSLESALDNLGTTSDLDTSLRLSRILGSLDMMCEMYPLEGDYDDEAA